MSSPPREPTVQDEEDPIGARIREDFLRPTVAGLRGGLTIRENFRAYVTPEPITFTTPDDWVPVMLINGFSNIAGTTQFGAPAVRMNEYGEVDTRGIIQRVAGAPAVGTVIFSFPANTALAAYAPPSNGDRRFIVEGGGSTPSFVEVTPSRGLIWNGGAVTFLNIGALRWVAANRTPPDYSQPIKLPQVPFRPELVWVHAKDPSGREQVVQPRWQAATQGIVLQRLPGLAPLTKYSLMVYALAG